MRFRVLLQSDRERSYVLHSVEQSPDSESGSRKKGSGDVSAAELNLHEETRTHHVAARIDQLVTA